MHRDGARKFLFRGITRLAFKVAEEAEREFAHNGKYEIIFSDWDKKWGFLDNFQTPENAYVKKYDAVFIFSTDSAKEIIGEVKALKYSPTIVYIPPPFERSDAIREKGWKLIKGFAGQCNAARLDIMRKVISEAGLSQPNFIIIGAQKSATSWLHSMLSQHPDVYMPRKKEMEVFSYVRTWEEWSEQYLLTLAEHFSGVASEKAIGEATPSYFWNSSDYPEWLVKPKYFNTAIPETVYKVLGPDTKLILSLRDPVDRAISAYFNHLAEGLISPKESLLEPGNGLGIVHMGFYHAHLVEWLRYFKRENILVLIYEDLRDNPSSTLDKVYEFLDIRPGLYPPDYKKKVLKGINKKKNKGSYCISRSEYIKLLCSRKEDSLNEHIHAHDEWIPLFNEEEVGRLRKLYRDDTKKLKELLCMELFQWN